MIEEGFFNNRNHENMPKTLWKEPQKPKVSFITAAEKDRKIPKRKPAGAQTRDKKSEEINKSLDTALTNQRLKVQEKKWSTFCKWNGAENL